MVQLTDPLGFPYPEDTDYDTGFDVPRAVRELAIAVDDYLTDPAEGGTLDSLYYQGTWGDAPPFLYPAIYERALGRVQLSGAITGGALNSTVVTLPSGYRPNRFTCFACAYIGGDVALVTVDTDGDVVVTNAPTDPVEGNIYLDAVSFPIV